MPVPPSAAPELVIRDAGDADFRPMAAVAAAAFRSNYPGFLSREQIEYMLENRYSSQALRKQAANGHRFLIAQLGPQPAAFASFGVSAEDSDEAQIHKIYIRPDVQGMGIGSKLVHLVEERVLALGRSHLSLTVNRLNIHAINFYIKLGFLLRSAVDSDIGGGFAMNDFVMAKRMGGVSETAKLPALR
jgi:ribosomal protein S18 acetylase RimI-like enzyme